MNTADCSLECFRIEMASASDKPSVMALYRLQKGREYCAWTDDYPSDDNFEDDIARDALFVMRTPSGQIIGAVSIEHDPEADRLPCWSPSLQPSSEFARVAVDPRFQNRGLARKLVAFIMEEVRRRGSRSVHLLVSCRNVKAIRSYAVFRFRQVGECDLYNQHFLCYEKEL